MLQHMSKRKTTYVTDVRESRASRALKTYAKKKVFRTGRRTRSSKVKKVLGLVSNSTKKTFDGLNVDAVTARRTPCVRIKNYKRESFAKTFLLSPSD
jgi:hypothetical protein